jgi:hypothetical protein
MEGIQELRRRKRYNEIENIILSRTGRGAWSFATMGGILSFFS